MLLTANISLRSSSGIYFEMWRSISVGMSTPIVLFKVDPMMKLRTDGMKEM